MKKFRLKYWEKLFPLLFALVYLPPKKDLEDWQNIPEGIVLGEDSLKENPPLGNSRVDRLRLDPYRRSHFIFNNKDMVSYVESKKPEWDISLSPSEKSFFWPSGAWSAVSLKAQELSHFYIREHRNGLEAKFRAYQLAPDFEVVDFELCDSKHAYLLQKEILSKYPSYRLTLVTMVSSQELRRDKVWSFVLAADQDILKLNPESCDRVVFEAWPKSLRIDFK